MSDPPTWTDALSAVASGVTALALVVGGTVGYGRYVRKREERPGCRTGITASRTLVLGEPALAVRASVTNSGSLRLNFDEECSVSLAISAIDEPMWANAKEHGGEVLWSEGVFHAAELLAREGVRRDEWLEPDQRFEWHEIIPLGVHQPPYKVDLEVVAKPWGLRGDRSAHIWGVQHVSSPDSLPDDSEVRDAR